MLLVGLARAPRRGATAEAIDAHEAVHVFTQQPKQPPIVAAAGNSEMEILVATGLVVGGAASHIRLPAMRRQALFERIQIFPGHGHGRQPRRHAFEALADEEQFLKIARLKLDDARPEMGDTMDQALCLQAKNGFPQRRPADAQPSRKVDFVDGFPGRDASLHDRLHDLIEDAVGERYARDGLDGGVLSTVYSHGWHESIRASRGQEDLNATLASCPRVAADPSLTSGQPPGTARLRPAR